MLFFKQEVIASHPPLLRCVFPKTSVFHMFHWKICICYETIFPMYFVYMINNNSYSLIKKQLYHRRSPRVFYRSVTLLFLKAVLVTDIKSVGSDDAIGLIISSSTASYGDKEWRERSGSHRSTGVMYLWLQWEVCILVPYEIPRLC